MSDRRATAQAIDNCIAALERGAAVGTDDLLVIAQAQGETVEFLRRRPRSGYTFPPESVPRILFTLTLYRGWLAGV